MASGPLVGSGAGGDGSREKHRWAESKVYTRKSHKTPKPSSNPQPPPPTAANDVNSSLQEPPPPPQLPSSSVASDDDASSLNLHPPDPRHALNHHSNGQQRTVTISLASRPRHEVRELRLKLTAELEQVRSLFKKREARELQLAAPAPADGYTLSQLSVSDPNTPIHTKKVPANSEVASAAPLRCQLSGSIAPENSLIDSIEKEKRNPKANQYYRNSDFVLGKEKFPPAASHGHKKSKPNGSKQHSFGDAAGYSAHLLEKKYVPAFKNCEALLSKLMKHKHGWVFNTPVDVKGLGIHDYYIIIKHPMDLGTVKSRLNKNWYKSPGEFAEDVRLTFRNAMTYNPKGQDVHFMAEQLSQIFEERWPTIEAEYTYLSYPPAPKKAAPIQHFDMRTLERSDSTVHPMVVETKTRPVNYVTHLGRPPALKKPKAKDQHKRDMTMEEKQRLSNNLQNMPSEKLDSIVQIIKKSSSSLSQHDDEIEVDIDSMDVETLWELYRFVTNYKKSLSKKRRKEELAILAKAEADHNPGERVQENIPESVVVGEPKESRTAVADEKEVASSSLVGGEKKGGNASRSSSSSSSSSDSGSTSSDSDSESSSANGSDAAHSPRT